MRKGTSNPKGPQQTTLMQKVLTLLSVFLQFSHQKAWESRGPIAECRIA